MFPDNICQNIDILVVINVQKNNFGFHSNRKTQGQKHQVNNLYFKYQVCQMKLRHLNTFLQFRLLFHEPHCIAEHILPLGDLLISNLFAPFLVQGGRNGLEEMIKDTFCLAWLNTLKIKNLGKTDFWSQIYGPQNMCDWSEDSYATILRLQCIVAC